MVMLVYSLLLTFGLAASLPWWGSRMLLSGRYREGLQGRLGQVPPALRAACAGKRVVWVHAVSVGEVLAVVRLVEELRHSLGEPWVVAVSTTTATGQHIARERLGPGTVFWFPLDFAFAVRQYLRALKPELLVLAESELWPRLLSECARRGIPVAVVNARVSDRGFRRTLRLRALWQAMANNVTLWLAQGHETAGRLQQLGIIPAKVRTPGNLKYDLPEHAPNPVAAWIRELAAGRKIIVAGSTLPGRQSGALNEEQLVIQAWEGIHRANQNVLLVLAPRHPNRFDEVFATISEFSAIRATSRSHSTDPTHPIDIVLLDTLGDLAAVYAVADVAFLGGSLVARGGHNPLEPARFGVPVIMGPSYENFREIVEGLQAADAIRITDADGLAASLTWALREGKPMGQRGRQFFQAQSGATSRTVRALLELLP